jgi:hypothetical protein
MRPLFLLVAVLSLNAQLPKPGSGNGGNAGASAVGAAGTMQTSDGAGNLGSSNAVQDPVTGIENHAKAVGWKFATVSFNAGSPVFDVSAGNLLKLTLTAAATATLSNAPATGWAGVITVCQDSTGGWTLTWPASFQGYPDVSLIALSTCMAVPSFYDGTNMNVASSPDVYNGVGSVSYLKGSTSGTGKLQPPATVTASTIWQLPDLGATKTLTYTVASGTSALGTSAISSGACATVVTTAATGTATTDVISASFNGDPTGVTGYVPLSSGMLTIISYPTSGNVNFKVCNNTAGSITPGAITLNWRVAR